MGFRADQRPQSGESRKEQKRREAAERQEKSRARPDAEKTVKTVEAKIADLEKRQLEKTAELEKPETYEKGGAAMQLNRELAEIADDLDRLNSQWEAAATALASTAEA